MEMGRTMHFLLHNSVESLGWKGHETIAQSRSSDEWGKLSPFNNSAMRSIGGNGFPSSHQRGK